MEEMGVIKMIEEFDLNFYKGKRVFVTGHTGFKGTWLCKILSDMGAVVTGYSLNPYTNPSLFEISRIEKNINSIVGDIRDYSVLEEAINETSPEIVFHLAAQPIVRDSYKNPRYTYETNVMGTVNLLECIRHSNSVKSIVNVTTDKVYLNNEWPWGYREIDQLNGYDPYSNSKSCSELVTHSYKESFFKDMGIAVSTARAGNVIGGGDFSPDRIIPDCVRAMMGKKVIGVRNPYSVRPYQHVLEPLFVYLLIAQKQYSLSKYQGSYNIGPDDCNCITTGELVDLFCKYWGDNSSWKKLAELNAPHEANFLKLDCSKLKSVFGWKPLLDIDKSVAMTCSFYKVWLSGGDVLKEMEKEISLVF